MEDGASDSEDDDLEELIGRSVENMPWARVDEFGVPQISLVSGMLERCTWPGRVGVQCEDTALAGQTFELEFARRYLTREKGATLSISGLSTALTALLKSMPRSADHGAKEACSAEVRDVLIGAGCLTKASAAELGDESSAAFATRARMLLGRLDAKQQACTEWRRNTLGSSGLRAFDPLTGVLYEPVDSAIDWPRRT